jgi:hypothetical protein
MAIGCALLLEPALRPSEFIFRVFPRLAAFLRLILMVGWYLTSIEALILLESFLPVLIWFDKDVHFLRFDNIFFDDIVGGVVIMN